METTPATTDDEFDALKCRYASKRCWNLRAIKRNGERHNLCEMHRQKANSNQRRLDKKRKAGQAALGLSNLPLHANGYPDLERRIRMRTSIAIKLEHELGSVSQFGRPQRPTSLFELQRAAGIVASSSPYSNDAPLTVWTPAAFPRSPRAMLRAAAMANMEPSLEPRSWMLRNAITPPKEETLVLPPIAMAVARSSEGLTTLQWENDRREPTLVNRTNM